MLSFGAESFVFQVTIQKFKIKIYRTIILPVVLYGCETWSLTRREERRLRVFENMVLRRIFGPQRSVRKAYHHPVPLSWNLGTLNSWIPLGHSRPLTGLLYLYMKYKALKKYTKNSAVLTGDCVQIMYSECKYWQKNNYKCWNKIFLCLKKYWFTSFGRLMIKA